MIIRTITCHEVYNHGASLQEYALLTFLNNNGFHAKTLHYKPPYLSNHFKLSTVSNPRFDKPLLKQLYLLAKLPGRLKDLKRKSNFDKFARKYIPTDSVLYSNNEELKSNLPVAETFICGSDQIWNSFFQNGKDPAFYLNFVPDAKRKIAYAASFAIDELADDVKPLVKENVKRLDAVGVRETSGVRILNELGIQNAVQVLDPVFLLDKAHWEKYVEPIQENFVFVYDFDSNSVIKEVALKLKAEKGYKIFTVNRNITYADQNFWLEGPEKFLSLVYHAKMNITNSFHSTAFSLIFEKQFVVVNRSEKINTRMRDLLSLFDLTNLISSISEFELLDSIEYELTRLRIEKSINASRSFLLNSLKG
jgi:hypothetical protein